jgi:glyoxylase-like metal-dependent hydrolase (beta-lactamase superfamily II)
VSAPQQAIPGVHRIELPLPFELERINLYVVALDRGYLLIDCGMDTPKSLAALEAGLREIGIGWRDLRMVLLTHMHPDHIGLSQRLRELSGAEFLMHEAEAEHLDSLEDEGRRLPYLHAAYTLGGVPADMQSCMDEAFSFLRQSLHAVTPDRLLKGGERLPSAIGPLTVLLTPGHSPGHVCLYAEESKTLFSGDHILNDITPNIAWHPERDALGDYLASLERIGELEIDRILPAHGDPFSGHRTWIEETTAHHRERCALIVAAAAGGARTAHEIVGRLWTRRLDPIHHHFAVFEVMAHLEYMRRRGRVDATESGGVMEWGVTN